MTVCAASKTNPCNRRLVHVYVLNAGNVIVGDHSAHHTWDRSKVTLPEYVPNDQLFALEVRYTSHRSQLLADENVSVGTYVVHVYVKYDPVNKLIDGVCAWTCDPT